MESFWQEYTSPVATRSEYSKNFFIEKSTEGFIARLNYRDETLHGIAVIVVAYLFGI